ncbi:MAG: glycosyltransferase family 4 protein [Acidobacteria bacterium]|nr:glycosyltransferase family 4 protein [Acidobacteriota bacterium]
MTGRALRLLYLADIRFPIERANGIQTIETCHALARGGLDVRLVVRTDTHEPPRDPLDYYGVAPLDQFVITQVPLSGGGAARRMGYLRSAVRYALSRGVDAVFTRDLLLASLLLGVPRRLRPPVIYESHGLSDQVAAQLDTLLTGARAASLTKQRRLARREARVWRRADGYVAITSRLRDALAGRFGPRPDADATVVVAHDGVRAADIAASQARPRAGRCVAAYAGHLYPWKGVDVFIQALARAPEVDGLVVGGHPAEPDLGRLEQAARDRGLADRVRFTGLVAPRAVASHLAGADVLVLPNVATTLSSDYSSPLKLFEYLAARRAIVASDLPAFREVVGHEREALLVAPGDAEALATALRRLSAEPDFASALAARAAARAAAFSWDVRAATIGGLVARLATTGGAPVPTV